eukprot:Gb_39730 [translate_table: standard]
MQWVKNPFGLRGGKANNQETGKQQSYPESDAKQLQDAGDQELCNAEEKGSCGAELVSDDVIPGGSEETLVEIPGAVVNLVDGEESVELGRGQFSLVRLQQGSTGIALFVKVGEDLLWPLTKDEPTLKLDSSHYLFSIRPPPAVAAEADDEANLNAMNAEILNYGVTFATEEGLELLDNYLHQHACFSIPTSESVCCGPKLTMGRPKHGADPEENSKAYWTALAPKVEDYNSMLGKAIAAGSGQIIKGLFMCSDAYSSQVQRGGEFVRGRVKAKNKPSSDAANAKKSTGISPLTKKNIRRVKKLSRMTEHMSEMVLGGVLTVSGAATGSVVRSKAGQKFFRMLPGEVVLASLDAFNKVLEAAEVAGKDALSTTTGATTEIVAHRFGEDAAEVTQDTFEIAGNAIGTAWNVVKIRKAINPASSVLKSSRKAITTGAK